MPRSRPSRSRSRISRSRRSASAVDRVPVLLGRALRIRPNSPVFAQLIPTFARELSTDAAAFHRQLQTFAAKTDLGKPLFAD